MTTDKKIPEGIPTALVPVEKPSFLQWAEGFLPFKIPRIPLPQTAKNIDKAFARAIDAGGSYVATSIEQTQRIQEAQTAAQIDLTKRGSKEVAKRIAAGDGTLIDRSIAAALGEQVRSQRNREAIAEAAAKELAHDPPTSDAAKEIDDDWLNLFATLAAGKSNADMQSLWGKVLAGEIRQPGMFRLRTLQGLAVLDAEEARLIHTYLGAVVDSDALFFGHAGEIVPFNVRLGLQESGVINEVSGLVTKRQMKASEPLQLWTGTRELLLISSTKDDLVSFNNVSPLTPFGRDLHKLANHRLSILGLPASLALKLGAEGRTIERLVLGEQQQIGGHSIESREQLYPAP